MLSRVMILSFAFSLFATVAMADPYFSGNLGLVVLHDSEISDGFDTADLSFDPGFGLLAAVGTGLAPGVRGEIELGYRMNDVDKISAGGLGSAEIGGDVGTLSLMANVFKDFQPEEAFSPFIGAGIGMAQVDVELEADGESVSDDDTVFAYQAAVGVAYAISETVKLDAQYRFFATADPSFGGIDGEYYSSNFLIGARANF